MPGELADRVAVITAAGSGMGREGAILFAAAGAHVVVVDIRPDAGAEVVDQIAGGGASPTWSI